MARELDDGVDWAPLDASLERMLSVRVDERQDASPPWLVVHLHAVRGDAKLQHALRGVASLVSAVDGSGASPLTRLARWTRVLTSRMMALPLRADGAPLWRFARQYERRGGVRVLLDWTGVRLDKVLASLRPFFDMERETATQSMVVGLCLARSRASASSIAALDALLTECKADSRSRVVSTQLAHLDLSDNGLTPEAIETLAVLLRHHEVQELRLENALYRAADPRSVTAVKSLLESAFSCGDGSSPLDVSLASNSLGVRYYQALTTALESATRPVRRLALGRTMMSMINDYDREDCWRCIASVMFSQSQLPSSALIGDSELDLSGNALFDRDRASFHNGLSQFLTGVQDAVREARSNNLRVWCRVVPTTTALYAPDRRAHITVPLSETRTYDVEGVTDDGWVVLAQPPETATTGTHRFVPVESIKELGVDNTVLLSIWQRFNSLKLDDLRTTTGLVEAVGDAVPLFLASVGPGLKRLSMQRYGPINEHGRLIAHCCPRLEHFDIHGSRLLSVAALSGSREFTWLKELQSLNLGATLIGALGVNILADYLRTMTGSQLRHLVLSQSSIGLNGLAKIAELLQTNKTLETVELDSTTEGDGAEYAHLRKQMCDELGNKCIGSRSLPFSSRLAFVWTVTKLRDRFGGLQGIDDLVLSLVLDFAAERVTRHFLWT